MEIKPDTFFIRWLGNFTSLANLTYSFHFLKMSASFLKCFSNPQRDNLKELIDNIEYTFLYTPVTLIINMLSNSIKESYNYYDDTETEKPLGEGSLQGNNIMEE